MKNKSTIVLTGPEVAALLPLQECISGVEDAFKRYAQKKVKPPAILGVHVQDGGYHIKAGVMDHFVAKVNANFPLNQQRFNLPTIQGVVTVYDITSGQLLALIDSIELTTVRTGAATAVATKFLAREQAKTATILGCGAQGRISVKMLMKVSQLETIYLYDQDGSRSKQLALELRELPVSITEVADYKEAVSESDICITCTTSQKPILGSSDIQPGTFIAAVGSDNEEKQELHPQLLASNKLVVDVLDQCATIGELHHALEAGVMKLTDVYAELGEIIAGSKPGRSSENETIIFDSTGMGLQDVAAASIVYQKALKEDIGLNVYFNK